MPCMCRYTPHNSDKLKFKNLCVELVSLMKNLRGRGDPDSCTLEDAHELIDHLYDPKKCTEVSMNKL